MTRVALFPIPGCVSFPGTVFPLHVFEPRYRNMVKYCIDESMPMAVCHTQNVVHPAREGQSVEQALQTNQATYRPFEVFSAGECELVKTLDDGRMLINVHLRQRYRALEECQTLPFSIYHCEVIEDEPMDSDDQLQAEQLRDKVLHRLLVLTTHDDTAQNILASDEWRQKPAIEFSFELNGILNLPAELQQQMLEERTTTARLQKLLAHINQI